jgi:hypothetical protein
MEAWSVLVAEGLPGWTSSDVSVSCLAVDCSLCAGRGPPSGPHGLFSASARKLECQPGYTSLPTPFIDSKGLPMKCAAQGLVWQLSLLPPGVPLHIPCSHTNAGTLQNGLLVSAICTLTPTPAGDGMVLPTPFLCSPPLWSCLCLVACFGPWMAADLMQKWL